MIKIENVETYGWEAAIRGMRNPMNSWNRSDSIFSFLDCKDWSVDHDCYVCDNFKSCNFPKIGPNDLDLMKRLANAGSDDRKYLRMVGVSLDITAPMYWWKEFDTYKVGTVRNSCSTMHKIQAKEFTLDDFSCEHLVPVTRHHLEQTINMLNSFRKMYNEGYDRFPAGLDEHEEIIVDKHNKDVWWQMIQLLPSSYNQRATVTLNYEVLKNMYRARKYHKLDEWRAFCEWVKTLHYSELITGEENVDE